MAKIAVAMSGGVDSSVVAALLKDRGHTTIGIMMSIWDGESSVVEHRQHGCYGPEEQDDIEDARKVAWNLEIPFQVFSVKEEEDAIYKQKAYLQDSSPAQQSQTYWIHQHQKEVRRVA